MHTELLGNRVHAATKAAGHARKLQWRSEKGFAQAVAVQRVVLALGCIALLKPHRRKHLAVVDKISREHAARAHRLAIGLQAFIHHAEAITLAQRADEINIARENFCELHGHAVGNAGFIGRSKQRRLDHAAGQARARGQRSCFDATGEQIVLALNHEALEIIAVIRCPAGAELHQAMRGIHFSRHRTACAREQGGAGRCIALDELHGTRINHAQTAQQRIRTVVAARGFAAVEHIGGELLLRSCSRNSQR